MSSSQPIREILGKNLATLMAESEAYGSAPAVERATEKLGLKVGRSTVDRAKAGANPLNVDYVAILARLFKKKPWQLLHPTMGDGTDDAPSIEQALTVLAHALNNLPEERRKQVVERLDTLALAPDSYKVREALVAMLHTDT
ncbi:hypothetical protein [Variovorax sp. YR216]|uniref:hypothetical protein n=1 Tax=Variovorax sp. YR216 TaxID=1882828 RepID=UPI0008978817|nr:hypothetical protein [Variovorax sp. YR216]SEB26344.1 hypothetical protein SAMN05444680_13135 [Variovorax sp. YR216]